MGPNFTLRIGGRYRLECGMTIVIDDRDSSSPWPWRAVADNGVGLTFDEQGRWGSGEYDDMNIAEELSSPSDEAEVNDDELDYGPDGTDDVLDEVYDERVKQDARFGEQNHHPFKWLSILTEEVGETAMAANDADAEKDPISAKVLWAEYREELVQVAAVAVAMLESFDRNHG